MADNPFEDPDVQAANNSGPPPVPPNGNVYGADNAYDDNVNIEIAKAAVNIIPADQQKQIAISAGSAVANQAANAAKDNYNESQQTQSDQHEAPAPPSFCVGLFNWFPLRYFSFIGGAFLIAGPVLDIIFGTPAFINLFIYLYLIGFGIVTMFVEAPTWGCTRPVQLRLFFWFRLLSRMWGRAWFYLFVCILCFAGAGSENGALFSIIAGSWVAMIAILSFIFSRMAGKKFVRMREFVAAGSEKDELEGRFMRKFDELDLGGKPGTIGSLEIVKLAEQAGRTLSNSERHAIQTFLDESCNGFVSKEDFMKMFVGQYLEKGFKQKFL